MIHSTFTLCANQQFSQQVQCVNQLHALPTKIYSLPTPDCWPLFSAPTPDCRPLFSALHQTAVPYSLPNTRLLPKISLVEGDACMVFSCSWFPACSPGVLIVWLVRNPGIARSCIPPLSGEFRLSGHWTPCNSVQFSTNMTHVPWRNKCWSN